MNRSEFVDMVREARQKGPGRIIVPVYRRLGADMLTPVSAFYLLRQDARRPFLLESVEGGEKLARYSFLGRNPYMTVRAEGATSVIERPDEPDEEDPGSIFDVLARLMARYREVAVPNLPRLTCGAVGFMSYDVVRLLENLPDAPPSEADVPAAMWCFYDTIAAFDHVKHQLVLMAGAFLEADTAPDAAYDEACARLDQLEAAFSRPVRAWSVGSRAPSFDIVSDFPEEAFKAAVEQAKHHIHEGDIFQVVLSRRFSAPFEGDPFQLYRALRQVNPSPYLFFLDFESFSLVGSSPEVLVRVEGERAELMPIAGTRPRGQTPAEDARLAEELLADPKECAEHVMLVDLGRNDLARVCAAGSVRVDRYAYVERYSHVMHIVSSVSGVLEPEYGPMDVLAACFPAGTVSGAPKVRAMEIIDSLEPTRRGPYAGAVGYLDFRGNMDTCITIRTMLVRDGRIFTQAGAGIVADSDPDAEYRETMNKARALHQAMEMTGG